jgi:hypothetical protein
MDRIRFFNSSSMIGLSIPLTSLSKMRLLGIPVIRCRAMQALHLLALEPIAENHWRPKLIWVQAGTRDSRRGGAVPHCPRKKPSAQWVVDSFFTTKEDGTGMGLPICRSIIEAHGGRIAAENDSSHGGVRFYFTLAAADSVS